MRGFLQVDPAEFANGLNLYAYVGNDPLKRTDPTGRDWSSISASFSLNAGQYGLNTAATLASGQISLSGMSAAAAAPASIQEANLRGFIYGCLVACGIITGNPPDTRPELPPPVMVVPPRSSPLNPVEEKEEEDQE